MFNLFKKKITLKSNNALISSLDYKRGIKLGSEIIVPNNFQCLIFSKGKLHATLDPGKYIVNKDFLPKLVQKQKKQSKKIKNIKFVAHFISNINHKLQIRIKKQKYEVDFCINNNIKFLDLILTFNYKTNDLYTLNYLGEIFGELLKYNKLDYKSISDSALENFGIHVNGFNPINSKNSIFGTKTSDTHPKLSDTPKTIPHQKSTPNINCRTNTDNQANTPNNPNYEHKQEISNTTSKVSNLYTCPKCGLATKFKTTFCIKCGSSLSD